MAKEKGVVAPRPPEDLGVLRAEKILQEAGGAKVEGGSCHGFRHAGKMPFIYSFTVMLRL